MNGVPPRGGPPPSPPISVAARSSNGTGLYSMNGNPGRKLPGPMIEDQLAEHHRVLKQYLIDSQREDHTYQPHNRARDKLLRLSPIQFQELSTDVYDELLRREEERRGTTPNMPRFLLPKSNFHPKRNQARQKLSTLASKKFRELSTDVLFELERRFPRFVSPDARSASPSGSTRSSMRSNKRPSQGRMPPPPLGIPPNGYPRGPGDMPTPSPGPYSPAIFDSSRKQFQSNTIIPNKGTMVEDDNSSGDEDSAAMAELQAQVTQLQAKLAELETQSQTKDSQIRDLEQELQSERAKATDLNADLEKQLKSAESLNSSLQLEVETLRAQSSARSDGDEWHQRYLSLEKQFHEQQLVTDEVRQEALEHLREMRDIAARASESADRELALSDKVSNLEANVEEWKAKYARTRSQLRSLRATSMSLKSESSIEASNGLKDSSTQFNNPRGLVASGAVTRFQMAVDELLHVARDGSPSHTLQYMRQIVASVRAVTADIESPSLPHGDMSVKALEKLGLDEDTKRRVKLKMRVSAAANNLITTSKTFASSSGLAPVSLIDAAATHLVAAVVELCKVAGVRPAQVAENGVSGSSEEEDDEEEFR